MSGIRMYHREMEERRRWGQFHKSGVYYYVLHGASVQWVASRTKRQHVLCC